ncbi:MAG: serine hydrolase [Lachnospiraceae bacterium]|nr:serine hydrolase [Lachnospiraceae bacterium]
MSQLEQIIQKEYSNIAGIVVSKDGKTRYENYFNGCTANNRIHVYSVTKSILSILIGIAIDKGFITSVEQKIVEFFPDYSIRKKEQVIQNITIRDMLTMTVPYRYLFAPYKKYFMSSDWVKFSLDLLGGRGKIGDFRYAPLIGPDILSGILVKATGQSVLEFANENLFLPLGIFDLKPEVFHSKEDQLAFYKATDRNSWVADELGINAAGWGLTLSASDMSKIGQLYLDGGIWNGKQIVSKNWVEESTKEQSKWEKRGLPYGYLWWVNNDKESGFAAMGDGGNIIYVNTERKIVVAITSLFDPKARDRIAFIKKYIEPMLES